MKTSGVIKNFVNNASVGVRIAVGLFFVLVIVTIVFAILNTPQVQEEQNIDVTNFSEISDAPKEYEIGTQDLIWQLIEQNEPVPDFTKYQAAIREGSYHEEEKNNIVYAEFIIDIEELRYSFAVDLHWTKKDSTYSDPYIRIRCPYYTDVIYPDTKCVAELPTAQIRRYLPHNHYLSGGQRVHVAESSTGGRFRLLAYIEACKDQNLIDEAMGYTREWIRSLYIDPDDLNLEAYDTCLQK